MSLDEKRRLVSPSYSKISIDQQCKVLGLARSCYYYIPRGLSLYNQQLMKLIDTKFIDKPFYGVARMTDYLRFDLGHRINEKRIRRLYRLMNLRTIYPKRNLSKANLADLNTLICLGDSLLTAPIRFGKRTLHISLCLEALCICLL
jgi:putative transposase